MLINISLVHICQHFLNIVFAVLCFINVYMAWSQRITQTPCAAFATAPMESFQKDRYAGQWFMHQYYVSWSASLNYNCYLNIRTITPDGNQIVSTILVNEEGLQPNIHNDGVSTFDQPGKGHYIYSSPLNSTWTRSYEILSTDYVTYAIEWNCTELSSGNECYLFILSRTPVVTAITQSTIDSILDKYHISKTERAELRTLNITSCPSELLQVPGGPGLLERVLQIVAGLVGGLVELVGGLLGMPG